MIIGGSVADIGDLWWQPFHEAVQAFEMKSIQQISIIPAKLANRAGVIGAAILAWQKLDKESEA